MSTVVSYTFLSAMTIGRDFLWRIRGESGNARIPLYTRWGLTLSTVLALLISLAIPSVVRQWYAIGSIFVPGLLLPVLTGYAPRWQIRPGGTFLAMLFGSGVSLTCLLIGWIRAGAPHMDTAQFPFGTQPLYPGLAVSVLIYLLGHLRRLWCSSRDSSPSSS
jgi:SSS family solute:Na+ symporter